MSSSDIMTPQGRARPPGRPRDAQASEAIDRAALRQLADVGYGNLTMESVAAESGVARATVYRRYHDKADLVTAAIASSSDAHRAPLPAADPRRDLVAYLEAFESTFAEHCIAVLGALMATREDPRALALHRERVILPRTGYVRSLLVQAQSEGLLRAGVDVELGLEMLVGAVIARRVLGKASQAGWADRTVDALWSGLAETSAP
jgi:AcrR family transcriptional regulator